VLKNFEIGKRRKELAEAFDRKEKHDNPEDWTRQIENSFPSITHEDRASSSGDGHGGPRQPLFRLRAHPVSIPGFAA
jgi:hypothetical protein